MRISTYRSFLGFDLRESKSKRRRDLKKTVNNPSVEPKEEIIPKLASRSPIRRLRSAFVSRRATSATARKDALCLKFARIDAFLRRVVANGSRLRRGETRALVRAKGLNPVVPPKRKPKRTLALRRGSLQTAQRSRTFLTSYVRRVVKFGLYFYFGDKLASARPNLTPTVFPATLASFRIFQIFA